MNIKITAEDYFNELKLMQKQYGQEEDLYPWIYMLLQMAECKKRENAKKEGKEYKPVSIRDVHNWKKKIVPKTVKEELRKNILNKISSKNGGPPEFLILNTNEKNSIFLGCVEMKNFLTDETLNLKPGRYEFKNGLKYNVYKITFNFILKKAVFTEAKKHSIKSTIVNLIKDKNIEYSFRYCRSNRNVRQYQLILKEEDPQIIKDLALDSNEEIKNIGEQSKKSNFTQVTHRSDTLVPIEEQQILKHLQRFNKLLYTNGLEFYLLKLNDKLNDKQIEVSKLADFTEYFNTYKSDEKISTDAQNAWDNLIKGLVKMFEEISNSNTQEQQPPTNNKK